MTVSTIPALTASIILLALFFVLDRLVKAGRTKAIDLRGIRSLRVAGSGEPKIGMAWAPVMRLLTQLGGPVLRYLIAVPLIGWLYALGYPHSALWLIVAFGSGWIVDGIVKKVFKRKRPTVVPHLTSAGGPSFPSGHTLNAALVYCALTVGFAPLLGGMLPLVLAGAVMLSVAVGFSRVWLGVHWPSDTLAGWMLGTGWWIGAWALGGAWLGH